MQLTLKQGVNISSLTLQHNILLQATMLLEGREGVLETEKRLYLMLATVDNIIEEDLLGLCNADDRALTTILMEDIEPFFNKCEDEIEGFIDYYQYMEYVLLERCREITNNQRSFMGIIDALATGLATMSEDDKKEVLEGTGKVAEKLFEQRTEKIETQAKEMNNKLEDLVKQYQRVSEEQQDSTE
jgi:hypothetical protein